MKLLSIVHTGGYRVEILEQLVHQYVKDRIYALEVLTAISTIIALTGLTQAVLMTILEFALSNAGYVLKKESTLYTYDVTLVYTKTAEMDGRALLGAGRQLRWTAYLGTEDIILDLYSENTHQYYNLSDIDFAKKAIENL